jgi:hypothetical protein
MLHYEVVTAVSHVLTIGGLLLQYSTGETVYTATIYLQNMLVTLFKIISYKYIDIIISQNTKQFYAQYVKCISQLHVSAHFRPSSGCSFIA